MISWAELAAAAAVLTAVWGAMATYLSMSIMSKVATRFEKRDVALREFAKDLRGEFMGEKVLQERFDRIDERLSRHRNTYQDNWDQLRLRFDRLEEWIMTGRQDS